MRIADRSQSAPGLLLSGGQFARDYFVVQPPVRIAASRRSKTGAGVGIGSDETQYIRPWVEDENSKLLVAEHSNGSADPFFSPHVSECHSLRHHAPQIDPVATTVQNYYSSERQSNAHSAYW